MDLFSKENIIFLNELSSKNDVLIKITEKAKLLGITDNENELLKSFMLREALGPTGLGEGLAIPHAKSSFIKKSAIIIVKSSTSIAWESLDNNSANLIIALMVPENSANDIHLKIISAISRKLVNKNFKTRLMNSKTALEIQSLFQEIEL